MASARAPRLLPVQPERISISIALLGSPFLSLNICAGCDIRPVRMQKYMISMTHQTLRGSLSSR